MQELVPIWNYMVNISICLHMINSINKGNTFFKSDKNKEIFKIYICSITIILCTRGTLGSSSQRHL